MFKAKKGKEQPNLYVIAGPNGSGKTTELALGRIKERVIMGGHDVPASTVLRRFDRGLYNLFHQYRSLMDSWMLFDNSGKEPLVIAKETNGDRIIFDEKVYPQIRENVGA